jgi:hypothetical protein
MATAEEQAVLRAELAEFLQHNNASTIGVTQRGLAVIAPWGDETMSIVMPDDRAALVSALNKVFLPGRFTGIWHRDTELFEIIFTAYPLSKQMRDLIGREFDFQWRGKTYNCRFDVSSERLLQIAENFAPLGPPGTTNYRNLSSFRGYVLAKKGVEGYADITIGDPLSFWISGIQWNDDLVIDLANHLNFFMWYFDNQHPQILVHSSPEESIKTQPRERYPFGEFPKIINGKEIDDNLLHIWSATLAGDPVRRFLYNYQILEYAAYYFIEETVRKSIRRLLMAPYALNNIELLCRRIIEANSESKLADVQKFETMMRQLIDPNLIFRELEKNAAYFSSPVEFDGGMVIQPILKVGMTADQFAFNGMVQFANTIRSIRNALSHGRDQRTSAVITPTTRNFSRLQPWVNPVAIAAREVMLMSEL